MMVSLQRAASIAGGAAIALSTYARGRSSWQSLGTGVVYAVVGVAVEKLLGKEVHAGYLAGLAIYAVFSWQRQNPWVADRQAFFEAAKSGNVGTMRGLLAKNPDIISQYRHDGWTALHAASSRGQVGAIELLLEHDPSIISCHTTQNITPLHVAIMNDHVQAAQLLYARAPHLLNFSNSQGLTPRQMAERLQRTKCLAWLRSIDSARHLEAVNTAAASGADRDLR